MKTNSVPLGSAYEYSKVTEAGWEIYLANYVAKGEPTFKVDISKNASEPEKYLQTRVVGRLEVDHMTLGHFLCCSSRAVLYLPTDLNPQYGFLEHNKHLPSDPESDDIFYSNMLEKYMERPAELENAFYVDWAEKYILSRSSGSQTDDVRTQPHDRRTYVDLKGRKWKRCTTEAVARWKVCMPNSENQEQYYMQKLVLNTPLRKDTHSISKDNSSGTYMEECALRNLLSQGEDALATHHNARQRGFSLKKLRKLA